MAQVYLCRSDRPLIIHGFWPPKVVPPRSSTSQHSSPPHKRRPKYLLRRRRSLFLTPNSPTDCAFYAGQPHPDLLQRSHAIKDTASLLE